MSGPGAAPFSSREWTWNQTPYGYDGVVTEAGGLLWFTHAHHSLAGGGASLQPYDDFRASGPAQSSIPDDVLAEVRAHLEATRDEASED